MYINDIPQTAGVYQALVADNTCTYATDCKKSFIPRKLQRSRRGASAGKIESMKTKLRSSISLIELDHLRFISNRTDGTFLS
jgi:hypothetical protein